MIAIQDLSKVYGPTHALRGISFEVPKGQVVGFLGPNGAGKSTTMKILTGYVQATDGQVKVAGIDVASDPVQARRRIGYLPESNPLYDDMLVQEYLEYTADVRDVPKNERQSRIEGAIDRCGLGPVRGKVINELSKGYRQRVGLAQAILHDPDLLILDEPTTGLDPNQILEIRALIKELGKEKTVLMSTHVLPEVQATCSRVLIVADGQIVADDTPERLTAEGGTVRAVIVARQGTLERAQVREALAQVAGVQDLVDDDTAEPGAVAFTLKYGSDDPRRALFDVVVQRDWLLLGLEHRQVSLEETFRRLTT
jgi:ABC-2 type transport system ATP-binding protein